MLEMEALLLDLLQHRAVLPEFARDASYAERDELLLRKPLAVLNNTLAGRDYLTGGQFSFANLNVASILVWGKMGRLNLSPHLTSHDGWIAVWRGPLTSNVAKADAKLNVSDMRLMALLAYVEMYASDAFDKHRQSQGLNITQSRILFALNGGNQLSLEEIIARSFLPRDSAEDALDSLTERGYVGGKPRAFALTESGRSRFTRLIAQLAKFEAEQLSGISQQDLAVTRSVLEKLYDRLRPS